MVIRERKLFHIFDVARFWNGNKENGDVTELSYRYGVILQVRRRMRVCNLPKVICEVDTDSLYGLSLYRTIACRVPINYRYFNGIAACAENEKSLRNLTEKHSSVPMSEIDVETAAGYDI